MKTKDLGIVVFAFIAAGKTTFYNKYKNELSIIDLCSEEYKFVLTPEQKNMNKESRKGMQKQTNPDWPQNYYEAISQARKKYKYIFVAYEGLVFCQQNNIPYWRVFPGFECKEEYLARMRKRGNNEEFVKRIAESFDMFVQGCYEDENCAKKIVLRKNEYLESVKDNFE